MDFVKFDRNLYYQISQEYSVDYSIVEQSNIQDAQNSSDVVNASFVHEDYSIPIDILRGNSAFSAIVFFLKNKGLSFKEIADITNRDQRTIWCTYNSSHKKFSSKDTVVKQNISMQKNHVTQSVCIPIDILRPRQFSVLESIVFYLKQDCDFTFTEIAQHLGKNYRTIYTVYRRAMAKNEA
ncbi:MAG: hypothetical protein ACP5NV_03745 [Candidatus Woesearchaeota archaeon]